MQDQLMMSDELMSLNLEEQLRIAADSALLALVESNDVSASGLVYEISRKKRFTVLSLKIALTEALEALALIDKTARLGVTWGEQLVYRLDKCRVLNVAIDMIEKNTCVLSIKVKQES